VPAPSHLHAPETAREVLLVQRLAPLQLLPECLARRRGQHQEPILVSLAAAHRELSMPHIHILDAQPALHQAQPAPYLS
jgi:hypothetical protein